MRGKEFSRFFVSTPMTQLSFYRLRIRETMSNIFKIIQKEKFRTAICFKEPNFIIYAFTIVTHLLTVIFRF